MEWLTKTAGSITGWDNCPAMAGLPLRPHRPLQLCWRERKRMWLGFFFLDVTLSQVSAMNTVDRGLDFYSWRAFC